MTTSAARTHTTRRASSTTSLSSSSSSTGIGEEAIAFVPDRCKRNSRTVYVSKCGNNFPAGASIFLATSEMEISHDMGALVMWYGVLADAMVIIHVAYVAYVVVGQLAIWL